MQKNDLENWLDSGTIFSLGSGKILIGWGNRKWLKNPSDSTNPCFYFPDYFLTTLTPWFEHQHFLKLSADELTSYLNSLPDIPQKSEYLWNNNCKDSFYNSFENLQKKINQGELAKAVPFAVESTEAPMTKQQLVKSLKHALKYIQNNTAYLYGFWGENEGVLGVTPEILFRSNNEGELETMACAGTRSINDASTTFLSDLKELNEHHLVVEGIKESLSSYGKVKIGDLQLLKLPTLAHLMTPIKVKLDKMLPFEEIVDILHPTPALGAFPKKEGKEWLIDYQKKIDRSRFGAPVGYIFPESLQVNCYVAIRNVQWKGNQMQIAAGCGVVAASICDKEWNEINLKLKAIKEMLAL